MNFSKWHQVNRHYPQPYENSVLKLNCLVNILNSRRDCQVGSAKIASCICLPALRLSISKAASTLMSSGLHPPISHCIWTMACSGFYFDSSGFPDQGTGMVPIIAILILLTNSEGQPQAQLPHEGLREYPGVQQDSCQTPSRCPYTKPLRGSPSSQMQLLFCLIDVIFFSG